MKDIDKLYETDPDFMAICDSFIKSQVVEELEAALDERMRYMVILAGLIGCQASDHYKTILNEALSGPLTPIEVKEVVYQATAYAGLGRVYPFLIATNDTMIEKGIERPLASQTTTKPSNRREKGISAQVEIFGEGMKAFWKKDHINLWLASNCFGDYYTRTGLSLQEREIATFCYLSALGGCESQLKSHIYGNLNLGTSKGYLVRVISQLLPYIGYPRSLNALECIRNMA